MSINLDTFNFPIVDKEAAQVWHERMLTGDHGYMLPYAESVIDARMIHEALASLYEVVGAKQDDHFFFASSEEEAMEQVFSHVLFDHMFSTGKNHILSLETEGAPTLSLLERFQRAGCSYKLLNVDQNGMLTVERLQEAMNPRVGFVSLTWVHPLTGSVQPLYEIADLCKKHHVLLHVRVTEALGKVFFRYQDLPIDFLTFDGRALHMPQGCGGFFAKKGSALAAYVAPVTKLMGKSVIPVNVPALIAMGRQAQASCDQMEMATMEVARLRGDFEQEVTQAIAGAKVLCDGARRVPHVSVMSFPHIVSETLAFQLKERRVLASMGGGREQTLEYVLSKMGVLKSDARSALSFALSQHTREQDLKAVKDVLVSVIQLHQKMCEAL